MVTHPLPWSCFPNWSVLNLESQFLETLKEAKSNIPKWGNGRAIYLKLAESNRAAAKHIFACGLLARLFGKVEDGVSIGMHAIKKININKLSRKSSELFFGKGEVVSKNTLETVTMGYFVIHNRDKDFKIFVSPPLTEILKTQEEALNLFRNSGYLKTLKFLTEKFGFPIYPKREIFHNFGDRLATETGQAFWSENNDLKDKLADSQKKFKMLFNRLNTPLSSNTSILHRSFLLSKWVETLESTEPSFEVSHLLKFADGESLDFVEFKSAYEQKIKKAILEFKNSPDETGNLNRLNSLLGLLDMVPMKVNLWAAQNEIFCIFESLSRKMRERRAMGEKAADE